MTVVMRRDRRGHRRGVVAARIRLGSIPGLVRAAEAHPAAPWLVGRVVAQVGRRLLPDVHVGIERQRQRGGSGHPRLVGVALAQVGPVGLIDPGLLPTIGEVGAAPRGRARPRDLVDMVKAPRPDQILTIAQITPLWMQMRLAEQARAIARVANRADPCRRVARQRVRLVPPHASVVRVPPRHQTRPRRDAHRRVRASVHEAHALGGHAVKRRRLHPTACAAQRVPPLLIRHQQQNVRPPLILAATAGLPSPRQIRHAGSLTPVATGQQAERACFVRSDASRRSRCPVTRVSRTSLTGGRCSLAAPPPPMALPTPYTPRLTAPNPPRRSARNQPEAPDGRACSHSARPSARRQGLRARPSGRRRARRFASEQIARMAARGPRAGARVAAWGAPVADICSPGLLPPSAACSPGRRSSIAPRAGRRRRPRRIARWRSGGIARSPRSAPRGCAWHGDRGEVRRLA